MIQVTYNAVEHVKASVVAAFVRAKWPSRAVEIALTLNWPIRHVRCSSEERLDPEEIEAAFLDEIGGAL